MDAVRELPRNWTAMRRDWRLLTLYQKFESAVALLLTYVIGAVIAIALFRLCAEVLDVLVRQALNPLDHSVFQRVFGGIMTLLIAMEFNHTLQYVIGRERGIVQARVVVLIAQLSLARKVVVADLYEMDATTIAATAALALALGAAYWLMDGPRRHFALRHVRSRPPGASARP